MAEDLSPATRARVDRWWARVLGLGPDELWTRTTVREHAPASPLAVYAGWWVVWRDDEVTHVSRPAGSPVPHPAMISPERRGAASTWRGFARDHRLRVVGPARHAFLDTDPGEVDGVRDCEPDALEHLRVEVGAAAWNESGFADLEPDVDGCFALVRAGRVVAAANLTPFDGAPRDVGVLVAPQCRGEGLGVLVGRPRRRARRTPPRPGPLACAARQPRVARCRRPARVRAVVHPAGAALTRPRSPGTTSSTGSATTSPARRTSIGVDTERAPGPGPQCHGATVPRPAGRQGSGISGREAFLDRA